MTEYLLNAALVISQKNNTYFRICNSLSDWARQNFKSKLQFFFFNE